MASSRTRNEASSLRSARSTAGWASKSKSERRHGAGSEAKPFQARPPAREGGRDLDREEALQQRGVAETLRLRLIEHGRQRLGGGRQAERGEMAAHGLVHRCLVHRAASTSLRVAGEVDRHFTCLGVTEVLPPRPGRISRRVVALALAGRLRRELPQHEGFEREAVLGQPVDPGAPRAMDRHQRPGRADDLEAGGAEALANGERGADNAGRHGIAGAPEGDRGIGRDRDRHLDRRRVRHLRQRSRRSVSARAPTASPHQERASSTVSQRRSRLACGSSMVMAVRIRHQRPHR